MIVHHRPGVRYWRRGWCEHRLRSSHSHISAPAFISENPKESPETVGKPGQSTSLGLPRSRCPHTQMRRCSQGESSVPTAPAYQLLRLSTVRARSPVISRLIVLPASEGQGARYSLQSTRVCSVMLLSRAVPCCPATCCQRIQVGRRLANQWPLNCHLQNIELVNTRQYSGDCTQLVFVAGAHSHGAVLSECVM